MWLLVFLRFFTLRIQPCQVTNETKYSVLYAFRIWASFDLTDSSFFLRKLTKSWIFHYGSFCNAESPSTAYLATFPQSSVLPLPSITNSTPKLKWIGHSNIFFFFLRVACFWHRLNVTIGPAISKERIASASDESSIESIHLFFSNCQGTSSLMQINVTLATLC